MGGSNDNDDNNDNNKHNDKVVEQDDNGDI